MLVEPLPHYVPRERFIYLVLQSWFSIWLRWWCVYSTTLSRQVILISGIWTQNESNFILLLLHLPSCTPSVCLQHKTRCLLGGQQIERGGAFFVFFQRTYVYVESCACETSQPESNQSVCICVCNTHQPFAVFLSVLTLLAFFLSPTAVGSQDLSCFCCWSKKMCVCVCRCGFQCLDAYVSI